MRQFLITAAAFNGQARLIYDDDGILITVDSSETDMPPDARKWLFKHVPIYELGNADSADISLNDFKGKLKQAQIIESDFEVSLDDFTRQYPYKRNSHLIPDIWKKMSTSDQVKAVFAAKEYRKYCDRNKQWYKSKIAATWLKDKEYLNDWKNL
jgi:hypothetical protein